MNMHPHPYIFLAQQSIQHYLSHRTKLPCPETLTQDLKSRSGAFVSIKKRQRLRGCIGTLEPCETSLAEEIIENAVKAALHDPRFDPVTLEELNELTYSIDVIHPLEKISDMTELDPAVYGLVVCYHDRQGVLLPDLEGVDSPEDQVRICRSKGKIPEDVPVELYRFQVQRFH